MTVATYKIRPLGTKDLFRMTKILSVISGEIRTSLGGASLQETDSQVVGILIIEAAMKHAESQLKEFLADIVGMTVEEFEQEPFDAPIDILYELAEKENLQGFFQKVQKLMSKFSGK